MKKDLISIIIPVYNAEKYLDRCISSIANQTYKDLEIILINDGSCDNSLQICNNWKEKDERIVIIDKKNEGAAIARNCGLNIAQGEYIGFVDADDYINEVMYEKLIISLKENSSDIASCNYVYVFENGDRPLECVEKNLGNVAGENIWQYFIKDGGTDNTGDRENISWCIWRNLYKADVIGSHRFENYRYYEDLIFLMNIINSNTKISYVKDGLYYYFQNSTSVVHSKISLENFNKKIETCKYVISLFESRLGENYEEMPSYKFYLYKALMIEAINSNLLKDKSVQNQIKNNSFLTELNSKSNFKAYNKNKTFKRKISNFLIHNGLFTIYKKVVR